MSDVYRVTADIELPEGATTRVSFIVRVIADLGSAVRQAHRELEPFKVTGDVVVRQIWLGEREHDQREDAS